MTAFRKGRSILIIMAGTIVGLVCGTRIAAADDIKFPVKPVTIVVGFPPGSNADLEVRTLQHPLSQALHTPIVIENIAGAGTALALEKLESAPADGYTLMFGSNITQFAIARKLIPYTAKDMVFLAQLAQDPLGLWVSASSPFHSLPELMAYAKDNPGKVTIAGTGPISPQKMLVTFLEEHYGVKLTYVPVAGGTVTVTYVLGNQTIAGTSASDNALPYVAADKLRFLWITQSTPWPPQPSAPTSKTLDLNFTSVIWIGFIVKQGVPKSIQDKLASAIEMATKDPSVEKAFTPRGDELMFRKGEAFETEVNSQWDTISKFLQKTH